MELCYKIVRKLVLIAIWPFMGKVIGLNNIPKNKPVILAANHASYLDHYIIGAYVSDKLDRHVHFLSKKEHFDNFFKRAWHNFLKAIPVDREAGGKKALEIALMYLKDGEIIAIHPEGTRTLTGKMLKAKTGVARLSVWGKVPVIPVGITNTFHILPKGKLIPRFGKADLRIGKPMTFKTDSKLGFRRATTKIMKEIAKLSKQKYPY